MNAAAEIISSSDLTNQPSDRDARGRQIAKQGGIKQIGSRYSVPSQSGGATAYVVDLVEERCGCPDWELHGRKWQCKHLHAVYYSIAWSADVDANGTVTQTVTVQVKRKTYRQNWPAYNAGQTNEGDYVPRLLRALCDGIQDPPREGIRGQKPIPLKDATFAAVMKVYIKKSQRRVQSYLADSVEKGLLPQRAHFNTISNFLADKASTSLLVSLIEESAKPLATLEKGQFAIDSTGFSTKVYLRHFDHKHGKVRTTHPWVKLHIMVGTFTHVIAGVKVCDDADCTQLPNLLAQTQKNFQVDEVSADLAYSTKKNLKELVDAGVKAFIPFKENAVPDPKCEVWSRHLFEFSLNKEKFMQHYHRRSNVETVNHMIKTKFDASVKSKGLVAQMNEVLAKCLLHNLYCLVMAIFETGLAPNFWQDAQAAPMPTERPKLALVPMPMEKKS